VDGFDPDRSLNPLLKSILAMLDPLTLAKIAQPLLKYQTQSAN
jgi:hypothetical protein